MPRIVPKSAEFMTDRTKVQLDVDIDYGVWTSADPWRALITVVFLSDTGTTKQSFEVPVVEFAATQPPSAPSPVPAKVELQLSTAGVSGTQPAASVALSNPGHVFEGYFTYGNL